MIFRSPYSDVVIPEIPLTQAVLRRAEELAAKPALIDGSTNRVMTYGELSRAVHRVAAGLSERGFRKGDVLAIFSPNLPEYAWIQQHRETIRRREIKGTTLLKSLRATKNRVKRASLTLRPAGKRTPG